jgi:hypothetical protein
MNKKTFGVALGDGTQGKHSTRNVLYQLNYIPGPENYLLMIYALLCPNNNNNNNKKQKILGEHEKKI